MSAIRSGARKSWLAVLLLLSVAGCTHHDWLSNFGYTNLPKGYHWITTRDLITHDVVYYATDPTNGDTLYIGPGGVFYHYHHPGRIGPRDLTSIWDPHDAPPEAPKSAKSGTLKSRN